MRTPAALLLSVAVLIVAACGATPASAPASAGPSTPAASLPPGPSSEPPASPAPSSAPASAVPSSNLLLTLAYRGGHCRTGPCDRTLGIDRDGRAHVVLPEPLELGQVPANLFQQVQQQLSLADFEALGSRPFTGECPVNFDGQELIYTFYGATGEIRLASCEVELDPAHPLFAAIEAALAAVQPQ